jgi:hypothetical protein
MNPNYFLAETVTGQPGVERAPARLGSQKVDSALRQVAWRIENVLAVHNGHEAPLKVRLSADRGAYRASCMRW